MYIADARVSLLLRQKKAGGLYHTCRLISRNNRSHRNDNKKGWKTTAESTKPQSTAPAAVSTETTEYEAQYGDSQLDFDTDNKFVDAVVAKYGIDREGLITAYSVKGRDSNYVWQFNGSRDENGKLIRNADTLKYVYYVNADCSKVSRTGGYTGNDGCTLKDGLTVFLLTQKVLIPNLQEQIDQNS